MKNLNKGFAPIAIVLAVIAAIAAIGGGAYYWQKQKGGVAQPQTPAVDQSTITDETADWKIYKNTEYGFQLTLNDAWKGYRVVKTSRTGSFGGRNETYVDLDFEVPTQDEECFISGDKNWMSPDTTLQIWTKNAWDQMKTDTQGLGGPGPVEFARNDKYVFAYDSYGPALGNAGCDIGFQSDYLSKYSYGIFKTIQFFK